MGSNAKFVKLYQSLPIEELILLNSSRQDLEEDAVAALDHVMMTKNIESHGSPFQVATPSRIWRNDIANFTAMGLGTSVASLFYPSFLGVGFTGFVLWWASKRLVKTLNNGTLPPRKKKIIVRLLPLIYIVFYFVIVTILSSLRS